MAQSELDEVLIRLLLMDGSFQPSKDPTTRDLQRCAKLLINGQYLKVAGMLSKVALNNDALNTLTHEFIKDQDLNLYIFLQRVCDIIISQIKSSYPTQDLQRSYTLMLSILFLQLFVQSNFTGPKLPVDQLQRSLGFASILSQEASSNDAFAASLQQRTLDILSMGGEQPYSLTDSPIFLAMSICLLEKIQGLKLSLLSTDAKKADSETLVKYMNTFSKDTVTEISRWWYERSLQILQSLYANYSGALSVISLSLLSTETVQDLLDKDDVSSSVNQALLVTYYLELSRCAIMSNLESKQIASLTESAKVSGLEFVLTGCKAKRTKYQDHSVAALTLLAKSQDSLLRFGSAEQGLNPQNIKLNDDTVLDKPLYDSIGNDEVFKNSIPSEDDTKRVKIDYSNYSQSTSGDLSEKLLPTAVHKEDIPPSLASLDPNSQPALASLDNIQLLLRMESMKQNLPRGSSLINEELSALVQRIIFSPSGSVNWLIFSRALWNRSLLEANNPKTVERGVIQLYSLVEELGVTSDSTARIFPKTKEEIDFPNEFVDESIDDNRPLTNSLRLKYIYLVPPMPKWAMDSKLAEQLISLGLYKSALEIYERLKDWTDAAVCCTTTGDNSRAEKLISKALDINPNNARALCILGDIKNDPKLWEKSWNVGHFAKAKRSLARYYFKPPQGIAQDLPQALSCMCDCLGADPVSFDNWYFYGYMALQAQNYDIASEAFHRSVNLDETNCYAWSNLASALIKLNKLPEAFHALGKAVNAGNTGKSSWRLWENYVTVAMKLGKWDEVLSASRILLNSNKSSMGSGTLDMAVMEKLIGVLMNSPYDEDHLTFFQKSCIEFICNEVPSVMNNNRKCWIDISKVDEWRKKPWLALSDYEKAYRATINSPKLTLEESSWNEAIDACSDLVAAYKKFGSLPGRLGAGDVVCKNQGFKSRSAIRALLSKGRRTWEYSDGYERLQKMKENV